jgi:NAD-dependent dihydropyrimidine dehydrogenase PreA subunit
MAYVITDGCTKDGECIQVCATDSIVEGVFTDADGNTYNQMFINPDTCIDCGNCEPVCPTAAIYADVDLPADKAHFEQINSAFHAQ